MHENGVKTKEAYEAYRKIYFLNHRKVVLIQNWRTRLPSNQRAMLPPTGQMISTYTMLQFLIIKK